jgi:cysteine-rich repeat protein
MRAAAGLVFLVAGCNGILGVHDLHGSEDAAPPGVDAGRTAVSGTAIDTLFSSPTTTADAPEDLSAYSIDAYVPDGSAAGFHTIHGSGTKDGTFTIPGVDDGPYDLVLIAPGDPVPHFYATTSHAPRLGIFKNGRATGTAITSPTTLTVHVTDLVPWNEDADGLYVDVFSQGANLAYQDRLETAGGTDYDASFDLQGAAPWQLEAARDDLTVTQRRRVTVVEKGLTRDTGGIVAAYVDRAVTTTDGQALTWTHALAHPTPMKSLTGQAQPAKFLLGVDVKPIILAVFARRRIGFTPEWNQAQYLAATYREIGPGESFVQDVASYVDPYPAEWVRYAVSFGGLTWAYATRAQQLDVSYTGLSSQYGPISDVIDIAPAIAAPHGIKIGGVDTAHASAVPFDGTHPVLVEWSAVIGVEHYVVTAMKLEESGPAGALSPIATFDTVEPRALMPASLFAVGGSYVVVVTAVKASGADYAAGELRRLGFPRSTRDGVTARLLFATSCGNGATDAAFEECDTSGAANATCNADCSKSRCGDAILNLAAGETCDDGRDSHECDADCTPVVCGDGHINRAVGEACDDHNALSGDGCDWSCVIEDGYQCSGEPSVCHVGALSRTRPR